MKRKVLASLAASAALVVGAVALVPDSPKTGCGAKCCRRPAGAPVTSCLRRDPHTNVAVDFGDLNTMPASHAVGSGCEPTECVLGLGIERLP